MMKSGWLGVVAALVAIAGCGVPSPAIGPNASMQFEAKALPVTVTAQQAHDELSANPKLLVIDFSDPDLFAQGHLPQSKNLSLVQIALWSPKLDKNAEVLCVDQVGHRSTMAAQRLVNLGFAHVQNLDGGIAAWKAAGFPLATGTR